MRSCRVLDTRIIVTRAREQAGALASNCTVSARKKSNCPPSDPVREPLRSARPCALEASDYDWLIFTSANGVRFFWNARPKHLRSASDRARICAIGPGNARRTGTLSLKVDVMADSTGPRGCSTPRRFRPDRRAGPGSPAPPLPAIAAERVGPPGRTGGRGRGL